MLICSTSSTRPPVGDPAKSSWSNGQTPNFRCLVAGGPPNYMKTYFPAFGGWMAHQTIQTPIFRHLVAGWHTKLYKFLFSGIWWLDGTPNYTNTYFPAFGGWMAHQTIQTPIFWRLVAGWHTKLRRLQNCFFLRFVPQQLLYTFLFYKLCQFVKLPRPYFIWFNFISFP